MRSTRKLFAVRVAAVLSLAAAFLVNTALVPKPPRPETTAVRAERLIHVGMTYDETKTALGGDGFRGGVSERDTVYSWSYMDSCLDVWFDADQRVIEAVIYKRTQPAAPFWDVLTHWGY